MNKLTNTDFPHLKKCRCDSSQVIDKWRATRLALKRHRLSADETKIGTHHLSIKLNTLAILEKI